MNLPVYNARVDVAFVDQVDQDMVDMGLIACGPRLRRLHRRLRLTPPWPAGAFSDSRDLSPHEKRASLDRRKAFFASDSGGCER